MTHSEWVRLHILQKAISLHLFLWLAASEPHCTFCERESHCIFSYDQLAACKSHCTFCERAQSHDSHHIFSYEQQKVSSMAHLWQDISSEHLCLWPTASEWDCTFCEGESLEWPAASEWHCTFCERDPSHLCQWSTACEWHCSLCERESHLILWPIGSEWHCIFCEQGVSLLLFLWQTASEQHCTFCERQSQTLIASFTMTNSGWAILYIFWKPISSFVCL